MNIAALFAATWLFTAHRLIVAKSHYNIHYIHSPASSERVSNSDSSVSLFLPLWLNFFAFMLEEKTKTRESQGFRLLLPAANECGAYSDDDNVASHLVHPDSCKLLNPHLSIYDALTNPDLDIHIPLPQIAARASSQTPPLTGFPWAVLLLKEDPTASFLSWQSVNFLPESAPNSLKLWRQASPGSFSLERTASILSSTDDSISDSAPRPVTDSMVLIPSVEKAIMVFETDEEDGDDDEDVAGPSTRSVASTPHFGDDEKTLTDRKQQCKRISLTENQHTSFIMPRMSLSDSTVTYRLTILSSASEDLNLEVATLIAFIRDSVDPAIVQKLHISHLVLAQAPFGFDYAAVRSSDLLFLVNDGSSVFPQFLSCLVCPTNGCYPKLTVINIMTSNYFVNLLEIINYITPQQLWKAPSLKSNAVLLKVKDYLDSELTDHSPDRYKREYESQRHRWGKDKLQARGRKKYPPPMSSDIGPSKLTKYKRMERQISEELLASLSYQDVDPLNLSSSLVHMRTLFNGVLDLFSGSRRPGLAREETSNHKYIYLFCGFSLGLGMGAVLATGATAVASGFISQLLLHPSVPTFQLMVVTKEQGPVTYITESMNIFNRGVDYLTSCVHLCVDQVIETKPVLESVLFVDTMVSEVTLLSAYLIQYARGGLTKATGLLVG